MNSRVAFGSHQDIRSRARPARTIRLRYCFEEGNDDRIVSGKLRVLRIQALETGVEFIHQETALGVRKSGKGRRKLGRKKRRMRSKIRHRKK
jgi:hypothetical protein